MQDDPMGRGWPRYPRRGKAQPLFVATGSTSSDVLLAPVLAALRRRGRLGEVAGFGGAPLRELGVRLLFDTTSTSSVGVLAGCHTLFRNAHSGLRAYRRAECYFRTARPALVILVDNSGNNLRFLTMARRHGLRVLYYVPPELWSLWPWEVVGVVEKSTVLAPLLRSEAEAYRARGGNVRWVGHPLVDLVQATPRPPRPVNGAVTIGLFPGSRVFEVQDLLPVLRGAAEILRRRLPGVRFVMCSANEAVAVLIREHLRTWPVPVELVHRQSVAVLSRCDLLLTCSGTVTLEATVLGVPQVAMYRMHHWLDWILGFYKLYRGGWPLLALPNRLLKRPAVPELINSEVNPDRLADEGLALLRDGARRRVVCAALAEAREQLGPPGAIERAADLVEELLDGPAGAPGRRRERERVAHHAC
jgi:lipid-A-disaccharide synthase